MPRQSFDAWCNEQDSYCEGLRDAAEASRRRAGPDSLHELDGQTQAKAEAFDRLIHDLGEKLPLESRIKKLAGLPLAQALDDFVIVPRDEWEQRRPIVRDQRPKEAE